MPRSSAQRPADRPGPRAQSQVRGAGMRGARPRSAEVEAGDRSLGEELVGVPAVPPFPASRPPSSSPGDPRGASPFRASERIGPGQSWVGGGDARRWAPVRGSCGALGVPGILGDPMGEISGFPAGLCSPEGRLRCRLQARANPPGSALRTHAPQVPRVRASAGSVVLQDSGVGCRFFGGHLGCRCVSALQGGVRCPSPKRTPLSAQPRVR